MDETVEVGLSALVELAIDGWRLQRWALARGFEKDRVVARQAARTLTSFLDGLGFETWWTRERMPAPRRNLSRLK